jgi:wobble nucleotide-excising tRNase
MQFSSFDEAKRTRLVRFLHTYSHSGFIDEQQHDPTILAETPMILKELMSFIEFEDKKHYEEMVKMIVPVVQNAAAKPPAAAPERSSS